MSAPKPKYKGVKHTTIVGRASFPALFVPKDKYYPPGTKPANPDKEYTIDVLFPEDADLSKFKAACDEALAEMFGKANVKNLKNVSYPMTDQSVLIEKAEKGGYSSDHLVDGAMYARFKTNAKNGKPIVVGPDMEEIIDPTQIYGGCDVRVSCQIKVNVIKGTDPATKKPISTIYVTPYLQGVQKMGDNDSFGGGRPNVSEMFEPVTYGEEEAVDPLG